MKRECGAFELDPIELRTVDVVREAVEWARPRLEERPILVYSTADAAAVAKAQAALGRERAGALIEEANTSLTSAARSTNGGLRTAPRAISA